MYNCTRKTGHNEVRNRINSIGCHVIKAACRNLINDVIINNWIFTYCTTRSRERKSKLVEDMINLGGEKGLGGAFLAVDS